MYPDDEFLPKAPEPEEIVIGDEDAGGGNINLGALADLIEEGVEVKEVKENVDEAKEAMVSEDDEAKEARASDEEAIDDDVKAIEAKEQK